MKTKLTFLLLFVLLGTTTIVAQTTPAKEFNIAIMEPNVTLTAGETKTVEVYVNRSKRFRKSKINLFVDNQLPKGIEVAFERATEMGQADKMILTASDDAVNYNGTLILKAKSSTLTKGAMFNLTVGTEELYSDKQ